jgi:hypothetical protein
MKRNFGHRILFLPLLLTFYLLPFTLLGWGQSGHRIIGEISESLLRNKTKKKITSIFGNASLAMISNWGDFVRSDSTYDYTATWHYTNLDGGLDRAAFDTLAVKLDNGQNVYRVIELIGYMKQNPNDTITLKLLVHYIQDMHCPMHMGRAEDRGGNAIRFKWFGRETSLHSLWDDGLIDFQKLSYTEYATHLKRINKLQKITFNGDAATILDWAWGTYQCTEIVYASKDMTDKPYLYNFHYYTLLESSLVSAAEHLAAILNYIYK